MNSVATRYAKALLQLALEKKVSERIHKDMVCFAQVCTANKSLLNTLKSPVIKHDKKLAVLQAIFQNEVHALTLSFFTRVTQRHREALLPAMSQAFLAQYDQHQGIKKAQVTTTFPLSDKLTRQLRGIIQKITPCKQVVLDQRIDPSLIGGYVLQVEGKRLDQSLRKKLRTLKKKYIVEGY